MWRGLEPVSAAEGESSNCLSDSEFCCGPAQAYRLLALELQFLEYYLTSTMRKFSKMFERKVFESSINMNYRLLWFFDEDKIIILLTIGQHKIVE